MKKQYGVLLIGCGYIGVQHADSLRNKDDAQLIAVIDQDLSKAKDLALRFGISDYGDKYEPYLSDSRIDIVVIATYTATHFDIAKACIEHGKHVICEKPIATNLDDAACFVKMVKESKIKVTVSYVLRYNKSYRLIKDLIDAGTIGDLKMIRMSQCHRSEGDHPWSRFLRLMKDCSPLVDCGVHYTDVVQWFSGSPIVSVSGCSAKLDSDSPIDNYEVMNMTTQNGCKAIYEVGWSNNVFTDNRKNFIGTKGQIILSLAKDRKDGTAGEDVIRIIPSHGRTKVIHCESVYKDMYSEFENLVDMIENNSQGTVPLDAVFSSFRAVVIAEKAIALHKELNPEEEYPIK